MRHDEFDPGPIVFFSVVGLIIAIVLVSCLVGI